MTPMTDDSDNRNDNFMNRFLPPRTHRARPTVSSSQSEKQRDALRPEAPGRRRRLPGRTPGRRAIGRPAAPRP